MALLIFCANMVAAAFVAVAVVEVAALIGAGIAWIVELLHSRREKLENLHSRENFRESELQRRV